MYGRNLVVPGIHLSERCTDLLELMLFFDSSCRDEVRSADFVLVDPVARKGAVLNLAEDLFHLFLSLFGDDAFADLIVAVFRSVRDLSLIHISLPESGSVPGETCR